MKILLVLLLFSLVFTSVIAQNERLLLEVTASAETVESPGDGASSAAIWAHPTDPMMSVVIGADDNEGVGVYDLSGEQLEFISEDGAINSVSLRYNFPVGSQRIALIAAGVVDEQRVNLYTIDEDTQTLEAIGEIETGISIATVCMYISRLTNRYYVIALSENGELEQYYLEDEDGEIESTLARAISVGGEIEGCVADDDLGRLYVSEGDSLVWRYGAEPENNIQRGIVDIVGGNISEEVEGLGIYTASDNQGYLIVTNEKSDSFLLYERTGDNAFVGEFTIAASENMDAVSEPTGLDVVGLPLGDQFPEGLLVTTDDVNSNPNADNNFKLVSWRDIASGLDLISDTEYDPRVVDGGSDDTVVEIDVPAVTAMIETEPVPSGQDAADDPAIWIHPTDTTQSTIIGTDKRNGLVVYDLDGSILQEVNIGRVNNVDLRYNFPLNGENVAIVGATNRTEGTMVIYAVDPETRELTDVSARPFVSNVEEVYGFCFYVSPETNTYYAFVNSADTGEVEQYELTDNGQGQVEATLVREFVVGSQTEGCVADDENGIVYIGEEAVGVWKYGAEPDTGEDRTSVDLVENGNLTADVEGVTIYYGSEGGGYLIVSSQGNSTFAVYEREGANAYIGSFQIVETETMDAVSGTDGLDVTNFPLNDEFSQGLLVVQDDLNLNPEESQNFKLVSWADIAIGLDLDIDTSFDPRNIGK
jgi:3-phytase